MTSSPTSSPAAGLRPTELSEFGGQDTVMSELSLVLGSAKSRGELCDHILFSGPPGLGKTTLAAIVAKELGLRFVPTSGPAIERPGDLGAIIAGLGPRSLLFIDEIHRLPRTAEELMYSAMEDNRLDLVVGDGQAAQTISIPLDPFVVVGATTQLGLVSAPLRDRFGYTPRLSLYREDALAKIAMRTATLFGIGFDADAAAAIARRARGTPRVVNKLVARVRDWAEMNDATVIDEAGVIEAMEAFGVDTVGLDHLGREILRMLCGSFGGGPVGVGTLAAAVGETPGTIEEVYEPFLMKQGFLMRTQRGRVATAAGFAHVGIPVPDSAFVVIGGTHTPSFDFDDDTDEADTQTG